MKGIFVVKGVSIYLKLIAFLLYALLRIYAASFSAATPNVLDDTGVYTMMGSAPLFSKTMLAGLRPPVVPLLYKIFSNNYYAIIMFQTIISMLAWMLLAIVVSRYMQRRCIRIVALLLINGMGMTQPIGVWDGALMSESINISLIVAFIAAVLLYFKRPKRLRFVFVLLVTTFCALCRESNIWVLLALAATAAAVGVYNKHRRLIIWSCAVAVMFLLNNRLSDIGQRWVFPVLNVISQRVLPNPERSAAFEDYGMPVSNALMNMSGKWASSDDYAYYNNPELDGFRKWLFKRGKNAYIRWLLVHPAVALGEPIAHINQMVITGNLSSYGTQINGALIPRGPSILLFPIGDSKNFALLLLYALVFCSGVAVGAKLWKKNQLWLLAVLMVVFTYPHLFIVWHADAMEVGRHAMGIRVQLSIAWWIMVLLFSEYYMDWLFKRFPTAPTDLIQKFL